MSSTQEVVIFDQKQKTKNNDESVNVVSCHISQTYSQGYRPYGDYLAQLLKSAKMFISIIFQKF